MAVTEQGADAVSPGVNCLFCHLADLLYNMRELLCKSGVGVAAVMGGQHGFRAEH